MAPQSWNGSQLIYTRVVRPVFLRHEATVDNMVSDLSGRAMNAAESFTREGSDKHRGVKDHHWVVRHMVSVVIRWRTYRKVIYQEGLVIHHFNEALNQYTLG